eukprot:Blabericola_migrator_1__2203@NODE_1608_length_4174_cov_165_020940_g1047_i0_p1_GENE_NODE_1608_length_4174_cov_165_020940_g1047_i0NODE_1608_length_4174_cov_165_020940_g1047_i0_p1_ORF_typecomplete_len476_score71_19Peptidase_M16/PF00675_20/2e34Peptidase_M16/PF00675_20/4_5e03Peptidase_M16_C/PF05193_21/2_9e03Peptidase_M16_C/PF05193_21/1_3e13M16C_assoc/PF08367_11/0_006M16C_assoc/PF08367_11/69BLM10_mid/PF16507_5/83BLM10_mid/PF16507_5/0_59_NODE_1608_length_4174_cov_165_020940_g1047_i015903017
MLRQWGVPKVSITPKLPLRLPARPVHGCLSSNNKSPAVARPPVLAPPKFQKGRWHATALGAPLESKERATVVKALPNGLTLIISQTQTSPNLATVGVWLRVGSGTESPQDNGVVHFLEHMTFKGTKKRTKEELERYIEQRGSHMNAYTTKEYVAYFSSCLASASEDMLRLIFELLFESALTSRHIEEEKYVVLRELDEVERIGEEALFDRIHAQVFPDHALGRSILGTPNHIEGMTRARLLKFVNKHYVPKNMIVIAAGDVDSDMIERVASEVKAGKAAHSRPAKPPKFQPGSQCFIEPSSDPVLEGPVMYVAQTFPTISWSDPRYLALTLARSMLALDDEVGDEPSERVMQGSRARVPTTLASPMNLNSPVYFDAYYQDTGIAGWYLLHSTKSLPLKGLMGSDSPDKKQLQATEAAMRQVLEACFESVRQTVINKIYEWTEEDLEEAKNGLLSLYDQTYDTSGALCEEQTRQFM